MQNHTKSVNSRKRRKTHVNLRASRLFSEAGTKQLHVGGASSSHLVPTLLHYLADAEVDLQPRSALEELLDTQIKSLANPQMPVEGKMKKEEKTKKHKNQTGDW